MVRKNEAYDSAAASGISGIKALGVRELSYRLAFLACSVKSMTGNQVVSFLKLGVKN